MFVGTKRELEGDSGDGRTRCEIRLESTDESGAGFESSFTFRNSAANWNQCAIKIARAPTETTRLSGHRVDPHAFRPRVLSSTEGARRDDTGAGGKVAETDSWCWIRLESTGAPGARSDSRCTLRNSGANRNQCAIKIARAPTEKNQNVGTSRRSSQS